MRCCTADGSPAASDSGSGLLHSQPAPPPEALASLLHRQRQHLRRLQLDLHAADTAAVVLSAACSEGSGVTDVSLAFQGSLPSGVLLALPGSASQFTALALKPLPGRRLAAAPWSQLSHLDQLASLSVTADLSLMSDADATLPRLTSLTRLRLHGTPAAGRPQEVGRAMLHCPPSMLRLELAAVELLWGDRWQPLLAGAGLGPQPADASDSASSSSESEDGSSSDSDMPAGSESDESIEEEAAEEEQDEAEEQQEEEPEEEEQQQQEGAGVVVMASSSSAAACPGQAQDLATSWRRLEALRLHSCNVRAEVLTVLPTLAALTSLHLAPQGCSLAVVKIAQRCAGLQELVLGRYRDYHLPVLPAGALSQLTRLRISGSDELMKLHPSWCALPNLLSFELESCEQLLCEHLPVELSCLTRLQRVCFSHQHMVGLPWQLTGLSQLTRLAVAACSLELPLPEGPYLRSLRELVLCVPAALAHPDFGALGLRRLDLSSNYSHSLSEADVAVLARLTCLTTLDLRRQQYSSGDAHPEDLLRQLRAALPRCDIHA